MSITLEIVAKRPGESDESAIARVFGEEYFDETVDEWGPPAAEEEDREWQAAWYAEVVPALLELHDWQREDYEAGVILFAQDYGWQIEIDHGSATLRFRNQWKGEAGSELDGEILEAFGRAGSVLLHNDNDEWWDLADPEAPNRFG